MRLTSILLLTASLHISAKGLSQKITLAVKNAPLAKVFSAIQQQSGLSMLYDNKLIKTMKHIDVNVKDAALEQVLDHCLKGQPLTYVIEDNIIIIKRKPAPPATLVVADAPKVLQVHTITGIVTSKKGDALPGVSVKLKGTAIGTATDAGGKYTLQATAGNGILVFSYIGFVTQEVGINEQTSIDVQLQEESRALNEIVVIGYGTQVRKDVTGAISSLSAAQIENRAATSLDQVLTGKATGINITNNSGSPGSPLMVRIRGIGTINNSDPLYVIDGNPFGDISSLDIEDIQSVEILKSASAAAIYGSRGANGVVLITTKKGSAGAMKIEVNSFAGFQEVYRKLPLTNGSEYAKYYNEALVSGGQAPVFTNPEQYGKGTDWQDVIFRKALITKHELAISGGSKESVYRVSGSFLKQEGIIIGSDYQRVNFTINASHKVKPWLQVGERINYSYGVTNKIADYDGSRGILSAALEMDPTVPVKNPDGSWGSPKYSDTYNPVAQVAYEQNLSKDYQLSGNVYGQIDFTRDLNIRSQLNLNLSNGRYRSYTPVYFVFPVQKNDISSLDESAYNSSQWAWENTLNYKHDFGKHHLQALLGLTQQHSLSTDISAYGENLPEDAQLSPALRYLGLASSGQSIGGGASEWGMISYFGRLSYDYDDKYLATVNVRRDGSSKFGKNNRFGTFPSFSLGWRLSNEAFMKDISFLNDLKLRAGWGQLGNEGSLSTRATVSTLEVNVPYPFGKGKGQQVALGAYPQSIGNPDLKWESTQEWDFGVDASFLNNRLTFSGGYYDRLTTGILARLPILALVGVEDPPYVNGGSVSNKGFEFSLGMRNAARSDFEYDVTVHFSTNHNKVVSLANDGAVFYSGEVRGGVNVSRTAIGQPIGSFWGYVMDGIFQNQGEIDKSPKQPGAEPGDIRFKDLSGDGKIDADDQTYIGSPWPTYNFGINGAFRFKNIDLNLTISGRGGNEIYAGWKYWTNGSSFYNYFAPDKYDTWHGEGTSNTQPRNTVLDPNNNLRSSTRWIQSGAYVRLNNVQLGYSLPQSLLRNIHITRLRFYIAAENLFTITKYDGYNPEVGMKDGNDGDPLDIGIDRVYYPQARSFSAGLNLSF